MRNPWTVVLAACLMGLATLAWAASPQPQEPPAPSNVPEEGPPPNGKPGRGGNIEKRLDMMSKQLDLTDAQRGKIRPILNQEMERMREVRSDPNLAQGQARRRMQMIRRNSRQKIAEVLTPEQRKQWQEMRQQHRGEGGPDGAPVQPRAPAGEPGDPPSPPGQN